MKNILLSTPSKAELVAIFERHLPASPLPPLGDSRWGTAFANPDLKPTLEALLKRAASERGENLPGYTEELYADYAATGVRLRFERIYFERRRRFARAAVALLAGDGGEPDAAAAKATFLAALNALFEEESWALPAHVHKTTGKDPKVIDLFAAETANLMAESLRMFSSMIPDDLALRIRERLHRDTFDVYLNAEFFWMGITNNWNAVCHQGVLGAALTIVEDAGLLADLWLKAARKLPNFLKGFGADGACSEGPSYWDYGFGWFAFLNQQLEVRSGGELSLFAEDPRIPKIAAYGPVMSLRDGGVIGFSDCDPGWILRPSTLHYLGESLDLEECRRQAQVNFTHLCAAPVNCDAQRADLFYWPRLFLNAPTVSAQALPKSGEVKPDTFLASMGIWIVHGRDNAGRLWDLAAKGGHNDEHHNHNDLGSFVLYVDGVNFISEIGRPEYSEAYFSPRRYSFLAARTLGHSLPMINGKEQCEGATFVGKVLRAETSKSKVCFEIDLTEAYPQSADCARFVRTICLDKGAGVCTVRDAISLGKPGWIETAFIADSNQIEVESPTVAVIHKEGMTLELRSLEDGTWLPVETHPYTNHRGETGNCQRLVLTGAPAIAEFSGTIQMKIR